MEGDKESEWMNEYCWSARFALLCFAAQLYLACMYCMLGEMLGFDDYKIGYNHTGGSTWQTKTIYLDMSENTTHHYYYTLHYKNCLLLLRLIRSWHLLYSYITHICLLSLRIVLFCPTSPLSLAPSLCFIRINMHNDRSSSIGLCRMNDHAIMGTGCGVELSWVELISTCVSEWWESREASIMVVVVSSWLDGGHYFCLFGCLRYSICLYDDVRDIEVIQ